MPIRSPIKSEDESVAAQAPTDGTLQVFRDLKQTGLLPSPHGVALRLIELSSRDDVGAVELARTVQSDPALAGRLLRLANSASFGTRAVVSIQDAVLRIGFRGVRQLAMGFSLLERCSAGACIGFDYEGFWSHSLATAVAAERLGRLVRGVAADECFTLGLLHSIGSLALATLYPREYGELLLAMKGAPEADLRERERVLFGVCRRELSRLMLEDWSVPPLLAQSVQVRGEVLDEGGDLPQLGGRRRLQQIADLMEVAVQLGHACREPQPEAAARLARLGPILRRLDVPEQELEGLLADVTREWHEWGAELNVSTGSAGRAAESAAADAEPPAPPSESRPRRPLQMLIVGESAAERVMIARVAESLGFHVRTAHSSLEGLARIGEQHADVVIADLEMPELDGVGLCRAVRAALAGRACHVVVLAGAGDARRIEEALAAGADDFLSRPLDVNALRARLQAGRRLAELQSEQSSAAAELRASNARLERENRDLAALALSDALTGLANRRHLLERLEQEWAAARRRGDSVAVIYLDVDRFKVINDERGHAAGDVVLERIGRTLRRCTRGSDVLGRFGGEEFLLVCPGTDLGGAAAIAERLRRAIVDAAIGFENSTWRATASFGIAAATPQSDSGDWHDLLRRADAALYEAKRKGRNRVCG